MSRAEAIDLVVQAIYAGIFNDLGSGSNCDVCVIEKDGTEMLRNYAMPNERVPKELSYKMRRGTTAWIVSSCLSELLPLAYTYTNVSGSET